jgi:hypothetical protein
MLKKNDTLVLFTVLSLIFLFITTSNFSLDQTILNAGASDGYQYFLISKNVPFIAQDIQYIKGERFILPYLIGLISIFTGLDLFLTYKIFSLIAFLYLTFLFIRILRNINLNTNTTMISVSLIVFNPYLFRYFLSIPTMIGDLIFMISSLLILEGLLKKEKPKIFYGFIISLISRQNGIIFFISFLISKLIFRKKSIFTIVDMIYFLIISILIFSVITFYAINAAPLTQKGSDFYKTILTGTFGFNYTVKEFILFIIYPLLSFGPILILLLSKKINVTKKINIELMLILILSFLGIVGVAFLAGPTVAGKNFIRLSNFIFPSLIIFINLLFVEKINILNKKYYLFIVIVIFILWSFHPTFSKIDVFEPLKNLF